MHDNTPEVIPFGYQVGIDIVAQHRRQPLDVTADVDHPNATQELRGDGGDGGGVGGGGWWVVGSAWVSDVID